MERFVKEFLDGGRAAEFEGRLHELVDQSRHFGEFVVDDFDIRGVPLLTKGLVGENFKENLDSILGFLLVENVSSIGIYGMGGIGKTTLAKHVNNVLLEQNHECVIWIIVSQEFKVKILQDEIAKFLRLDLADEHNEDKRAYRLNRELSERKNLVFIFDDVWKAIDLEKLGDPLSMSGCKLLITTRSRDVCRQMDCKQIISVKTLGEDEAWNLFKRTFGQDMNLTPEVQEIAESMVKQCDGLPLGIITIAGSMKGETDSHSWREAHAELSKCIGSEDMQEKVFKVLKYSFDRLYRRDGKNIENSKFHHCFLYCSMYPGDFLIERKELIRNFILEEYLDIGESKEALFSQGHAILNKLENACLLERVDDDLVKMHDLVRAMALKITEGKVKVIAGQYHLKEIPTEEEWIGIDKMSLMHNGIETISDGVSPKCPKLSTVLLEGNGSLEFIPNSFLLQMHSLFILDLSETMIKKLPDSLSDMKSLKALLLRGCTKLEFVPYLGKLKALKELDLTETSIEEVPQGMEELVNHKCLYLPFLPITEIEKLKHLEVFHGLSNDVDDFKRLRPKLAYKIRVGPTPTQTFNLQFFPIITILNF